MTLPMSRPQKHSTGGVNWSRKRVPDDLRQFVGKREEKLSLGTRNPEEARRTPPRKFYRFFESATIEWNERRIS